MQLTARATVELIHQIELCETQTLPERRPGIQHPPTPGPIGRPFEPQGLLKVGE